MKTDQPTHTVVSGSDRRWHPIGTAYMERDGSLRVFFDKPEAILSFRVEPIRRTFWQRLRAAVAASEILSRRFGDPCDELGGEPSPIGGGSVSESRRK